MRTEKTTLLQCDYCEEYFETKNVSNHYSTSVNEKYCNKCFRELEGDPINFYIDDKRFDALEN